MLFLGGRKEWRHGAWRHSFRHLLPIYRRRRRLVSRRRPEYGRASLPSTIHITGEISDDDHVDELKLWSAGPMLRSRYLSMHACKLHKITCPIKLIRILPDPCCSGQSLYKILYPSVGLIKTSTCDVFIRISRKNNLQTRFGVMDQTIIHSHEPYTLMYYIIRHY